MESKRIRIIAISLLFFPATVLAYEPTTTHAGLTREIISYYELLTGNVLEKYHELIIQGSMDEDTPSIRALNHFYDPVHDRGLKNYRSAKDWATSRITDNRFTWEDGIEAYARGDKERAFYALGRIIHLIEDSSVPDHTRDDAHPPYGDSWLHEASMFEGWADEHKNRTTLAGLGKALFEKTGVRFDQCLNLADCFDAVAGYSNGNFFSRDTIIQSKYRTPTIEKISGGFVLWDDPITHNPEKLLATEINIKSGLIFYSFRKEDDVSVLSSYFTRLSAFVIPAGATLIGTFIKEGEEARAEYLAEQEVERLKKLRQEQALQDAGFLKKIALVASFTAGSGLKKLANEYIHFTDRTGKTFAFAVEQSVVTTRALAYSSPDVAMAGERINRNLWASVLGSVRTGAELSGQTTRQSIAYIQQVGAEMGSEATDASSETRRLADLLRELNAAKRALDQLGSRSIHKSEGEAFGARTERPDTNADIMKLPPSVGITSSGGTGGGTTNDKTSGGVTSFDSLVGTTSPASFPIEESTSTETTIIPADETPPDAPIVTEPALGASAFGTTTVTFFGTGEAASTLLATSTNGAGISLRSTTVDESGNWTITLVLQEGTTTVSFVLRDAAENISSTTERVVAVALPPAVLIHISAGSVLLSEIMWGPRDMENEWVELYNATDAPVDLAYLTLKTADEGMSVALSGVIAPHSYYVLSREREDGSSALVFPTPDLVASFGLGLDDGGEELVLVGEDETVIDVLPYCANWCGKGGGIHGLSMERHRPLLATGDYSANWGMNIGYLSTAQIPLLANGEDTTGLVVGTPGMRNSVNYLFTLGDTLSSDFITSEQLYIAPAFSNTFIPFGKTLTILPGTVVKFMHGVDSVGAFGISVNGSIVAEGTAELPIIFTSIDDDSVLGDTAADGVTEIRRAGWIGGGTSAEASFSHVELRHLSSGTSFISDFSLQHVSITDSGSGAQIGDGGVLTASDLLITDTRTPMYASGGSFLQLASTTIQNAELGIVVIGSTIIATDIAISGVSDGAALLLDQRFREDIATSSIIGLHISGVADGDGILIKEGALNLSNATITDATNGIYA
ncbi:MAG: lamin tail domain-containing protein, partial [Patescibacteria group bacterium]